MKKQEFIQMKGLDVKELKLKARAVREEIANLQLDKNMKKLKDLKMVSKKKKELAQMLTVVRQKEELSVLSGQLKTFSSGETDKGSSKPKTGKPESEKMNYEVERKQKTDNRKTGGKK